LQVNNKNCYSLIMIKIVGNDIWRGSDKIGWIQDEKIFSHDGKKLGYFEGGHIFNADGYKIGYIEGNEIRSTTDERVIHIEDNHEHVSGGEASDTCRAAIRLLLGD